MTRPASYVDRQLIAPLTLDQGPQVTVYADTLTLFFMTLTDAPSNAMTATDDVLLTTLLCLEQDVQVRYKTSTKVVVDMVVKDI